MNDRKNSSGVSFKKAQIAVTFASIIGLSGCGILGKKEDMSRTFSNQEGGCLDTIGDKATQYIDGEISAASWAQVFDCVENQLDTFDRFVKPETPAGYSQADITGLIANFLIKTKPVNNDLTQGFLQFKASLFGGTRQLLTKSELTQVRKFILGIKSASLQLLPAYQSSLQQPSRQNFINLLTAFDAAAADLNASLSISGNEAFTEENARNLAKTLSTMGYDFNLTEVEKWVTFLTRSKYFLVRGNVAGIQGQDWLDLVALAGSLGGAAYVFMKDETNDGVVGLAMTDRLEKTLRQTLTKWNGNILISQLDQILLAAPDAILTGQKELFRTGLRNFLKSQQNQPPALPLIAGSRNVAGLDASAVNTLVGIFRTGYQAHVLIAEVFDQDQNLSLLPTSVAGRANNYASQTSDPARKAAFQRIARLGERYPGYFRPNEDLIWFGDQVRHYATNLRKLSWYEITAERLLSAYGSRTNTYGIAGTVNDLKKLVNDVYTLLLAISMIHPDKTDIHKKRFREINLFTSMGNGDDLADVRETTAYLAQLLSTTPLSREMQSDLFQSETASEKGICPKVGMDPKLFLPQFEINCFRREFAARIPSYFRNVPQFISEYNASSANERNHFMEIFEEASKFSGFDSVPVTKYDIASYSGIPTLAETAFQKFDIRGGVADQRIDRYEALQYAFPIFKNELASITKINIEILNKAVLLYLLQKGRSPLKCVSKPTVQEITDLIGWLVNGGPFKEFQAPRIRIYEIFAALSSIGSDSCGGSSASGQSVDAASENEILPVFESAYQPALPYLPESL